MTPTPRTDEEAEYWLDPAMSGEHQIVPADFARQLERENQTFRAAQKACEDCDAPRVDRIAELERELATEREQLAANHEATRLIGKWLEAERALADRLAALLQRDRDGYGGQEVNPECDCCDCEYLCPIDEALAAWKEARSGTV